MVVGVGGGGDCDGGLEREERGEDEGGGGGRDEGPPFVEAEDRGVAVGEGGQFVERQTLQQGHHQHHSTQHL